MTDAYDPDPFADDPFRDDSFGGSAGFAGVRVYAPRSATQVLGDTTEFVRENLGDLVRASGRFVGPVFAVALLAGAAATWLLVGDLSTGLGVGLMLLAGVGLLVAMLLYNTACYAYLRLYHEEGPGYVTPEALRMEVGRLFWPLLGLNILIGLFSLVLQTVAVVPLIGTALYVALYLFTLPVLMLPPAIYALRSARAMASISRAVDLVKPRWWEAFLAAVLLYLLLLVGFFAAALVPGMIGGLAVAALGLSGVLGALAFVPMVLTMGALGLGGAFFLSTGATLLYGSLAEQADGVSLSARVDALDDLDAPTDPPSW
ncbi:MAG: hypothetical protein AAGF99_02820 [Bacteroidota bacterium]